MDDHNLKLTEYTEVCNNIRQYIDMRFRLLTLFFALTGALLVSLVNAQLQNVDLPLRLPSPFDAFKLRTPIFIGAAGLVTSALFWIMEERANDYWHHFVRLAARIEKELKYEQYGKRPYKDWISATNAVRILYALPIIFWTTFAGIQDWAAWLIILLVIGILVYKIVTPYLRNLKQ